MVCLVTGFLHMKGSLVGLLDWIIHECENMKWDGGFYRETKGSRGREWANERKAHHALRGEEVGGPPSPLLR